MKRMTSIVNAELLGVLSIPFVATLMARGVFYVDGFPWFVGALPVVRMCGLLRVPVRATGRRWTGPTADFACNLIRSSNSCGVATARPDAVDGGGPCGCGQACVVI